MNALLALDTATPRASLAIGAAGASAADVVIAEGQHGGLSRAIETVTARALAEQGVAIGAIGGVIVADGPGSFTGLRIGAAFAKGLCRALGVPLLAAPSMLGAAVSAAGACTAAATVVVEYDALRGDVYRASWRLEPGGGRITALLPLSVVSASVSSSADPAALRASERHASAAALLRAAAQPDLVRVVTDPATWEPVYGRPAEAEARRLAGLGHAAP